MGNKAGGSSRAKRKADEDVEEDLDASDEDSEDQVSVVFMSLAMLLQAAANVKLCANTFSRSPIRHLARSSFTLARHIFASDSLQTLLQSYGRL